MDQLKQWDIEDDTLRSKRPRKIPKKKGNIKEFYWPPPKGK
jgi:hypothetical protein